MKITHNKVGQNLNLNDLTNSQTNKAETGKTDAVKNEKVNAKKLEIILNPFACSSAGFYLYYPSKAQVMPKLRAFIDHAKNF